jgi:DNA-binding PadR family transcriptional regulator
VSEAALLSLVAVHPHPRELARRAPGTALFPGLRRLERAGLVARRRGLYRVTARGRGELALERALRVRIARALAA